MRTYRSNAGPFVEKPFFKPGEIDSICSEELMKVGLFPDRAEPIRVERFIEKRFEISPIYEPTPPGVLGFTRFSAKGVSSITLSSKLIEDKSKAAQRRVNSTLAHEAGHALLHAYLFILAAASDVVDLFGGQIENDVPRILCRDEVGIASGGASQRRYDGRWWELQANQAIGGLLLPQALVRCCLAPLLRDVGSFGERTIDRDDRENAVRMLVDAFDVNPVVARIRIDQMFPSEADGQLKL